MRPARLAIAFLLAVVGIVWLGQGMGLVGGSFMTGSPTWSVVGCVLVVLALALAAIERRRGT